MPLSPSLAFYLRHCRQRSPASLPGPPFLKPAAAAPLTDVEIGQLRGALAWLPGLPAQMNELERRIGIVGTAGEEMTNRMGNLVSERAAFGRQVDAMHQAQYQQQQMGSQLRDLTTSLESKSIAADAEHANLHRTVGKSRSSA